jgi:hypothetical protein
MGGIEHFDDPAVAPVRSRITLVGFGVAGVCQPVALISLFVATAT